METNAIKKESADVADRITGTNEAEQRLPATGEPKPSPQLSSNLSTTDESNKTGPQQKLEHGFQKIFRAQPSEQSQVQDSKNTLLSHALTGNGTPRPSLIIGPDQDSEQPPITPEAVSYQNELLESTTVLPWHQVYAFQQPDSGRVVLYTAGLHHHGLPELFAEEVPEHRVKLVTKNMYFLASRMLSGHRNNT